MTTRPNPQQVPEDHYENNVGRPTTPDRRGLNETHVTGPVHHLQEPDGSEEEEARPGDRPVRGEQTGDNRYARDEGARNPNLDPQPQNTPGLEDGAGVAPGETPPESNSASASPPAPAPPTPPKTKTVTAVAAAAIVLLVLLVFIGYVVGLIG